LSGRLFFSLVAVLLFAAGAHADGIQGFRYRFVNTTCTQAYDMHFQIVSAGTFASVGPFVTVVPSADGKSLDIKDIYVPSGQGITLDITFNNFDGHVLSGYWTNAAGANIGPITFGGLTVGTSDQLNCLRGRSLQPSAVSPASHGYGP
jgi:hypothetical protein